MYGRGDWVRLTNYCLIQVLGTFTYSDMNGCGRGVAHQTCFTLMVRSTEEASSSLCVYALEAPSLELAHAICVHIG